MEGGRVDKWHLSEPQSHSRLTQCPLFFPAEFIEQFKEHLNQRKWTQSPLFPEQNLLNSLKNI